MSRTVKTGGSKPKNPPRASTSEVIKSQGSVPFCDYKAIPTPKNLGKGKVTRGTSRGMGAMLRGGKFTIN
jgi:hypothetical protein